MGSRRCPWVGRQGTVGQRGLHTLGDPEGLQRTKTCYNCYTKVQGVEGSRGVVGTLNPLIVIRSHSSLSGFLSITWSPDEHLDQTVH